jgi:hypothetical protein
LWDHLNATFDASDACGEVNIMESFHDYKMVGNRSIRDQAHEVQRMARELELLNYVIPDKFMAGCIIPKLPPLWRGFGTTLKHKRQKISVQNLIVSLNVEEKVRAKNTIEKGNECHSSINLVQRNPHGKSKGENKPFNVKLTTTFEKKKNKAELPCFTYGKWSLFQLVFGSSGP